MVWTYIPGISREELIQKLIAPSHNETARFETLVHADQGCIVWSVERITYPDGRSLCYIVCFLLDTSRGQWGYRGMEESMHPYGYSCPLDFLDMAPETCPAWREGVRAYHAKHARVSHGTPPPDPAC
jgi:hypothetical protein